MTKILTLNINTQNDKIAKSLIKRIRSSNFDKVNVNINITPICVNRKDSPNIKDPFYFIKNDQESERPLSNSRRNDNYEMIINEFKKDKSEKFENYSSDKINSKWSLMKSIYKGIVNFQKISTKSINEVQKNYKIE